MNPKSYKRIAVTNRNLCEIDFLTRLQQIQDRKYDDYDLMILREKDLSEEEYFDMSKKVLQINPDCILHNFIDVAIRLKHNNIHLSMEMLRDNIEKLNENISFIGASIHSLKEALEAEKLGASYVIYGHIFPTDCKKGVKPRGLSTLEEIVKALTIPVYAIGGIDKVNINQVLGVGVAGICQMSLAMKGNV